MILRCDLRLIGSLIRIITIDQVTETCMGYSMATIVESISPKILRDITGTRVNIHSLLDLVLSHPMRTVQSNFFYPITPSKAPHKSLSGLLYSISKSHGQFKLSNAAFIHRPWSTANPTNIPYVQFSLPPVSTPPPYITEHIPTFAAVYVCVVVYVVFGFATTYVVFAV